MTTQWKNASLGKPQHSTYSENTYGPTLFKMPKRPMKRQAISDPSSATAKLNRATMMIRTPMVERRPTVTHNITKVQFFRETSLLLFA